MGEAQKRLKHIPERTCIACRRRRQKWEMLRIVCDIEGKLEIDTRGKKSGRGAYLCKSLDCWNAGLKKKKIEHALKCHVTSEQLMELQVYVKTIVNDFEETETRA